MNPRRAFGPLHRLFSRPVSGLALLMTTCWPVLADGPADNSSEKVRPVPPRGIQLAPAARAELTQGADALARELESLQNSLPPKSPLRPLLPDIQIYHKAVDWALRYDEFFKSNEVQVARQLLQQGMERAAALRTGQAPWTTATGLVVRGYVSRIDGSVQPYGLVVPASYRPASGLSHRLDFWFHGRGETLTELDFIQGRQKSVGEFAPPDTFVLHPYGRYCNGNKFAGETDAFEAWEQVQRLYPIDANRVTVRGFSLGGAACWHMAVHHSSLWAAAAPGAGFSETPDFLKVFQNEKLQPSWYEQKLWHLYDCTDWAANLAQCPTVAYSGEIDRQKQAADVMAAALQKEGVELVHVIGPKTAHSYHADAKVEINRRIDDIVRLGREPAPETIRFTTWTLRYNRMNWVTVDSLDQHWEKATVEAAIQKAENAIRVSTRNVSALTIDFAPGLCPLSPSTPARILIDRSKLPAPPLSSDRSWKVALRRTGSGRWEITPPPTASKASNSIPAKPDWRKRHGLQGPIDDAFLDSFLIVRPTGAPRHAAVGRWVASELARATNEWRRHFRGDARLKDDVDVTDADLAAHHVVLWGDPASNRLLARLAGQLPIEWSADSVKVGRKDYNAAKHGLILIHPNPLNPAKYVVLNSGFTFREYDYLNNARQVPKLPDYAVIDVSTPPSPRFPGAIVDAGFLGERWELLPDGGKTR